MKINLNNNKRIAGELAARNLSEKAQSVFYGSDATLWEYTDDDDNKLYALNLDNDNPASADVGLTFEDVEQQLESLAPNTVLDYRGIEIDYDYAVELMDDDLREELHRKLAPCSDQEFFTAYEEAHKEKYGTNFETV